MLAKFYQNLWLKFTDITNNSLKDTYVKQTPLVKHERRRDNQEAHLHKTLNLMNNTLFKKIDLLV